MSTLKHATRKSRAKSTTTEATAQCSAAEDDVMPSTSASASARDIGSSASSGSSSRKRNVQSSSAPFKKPRKEGESHQSFQKRLTSALKKEILDFLHEVGKNPASYFKEGNDMGSRIVDMTTLKEELLEKLKSISVKEGKTIDGADLERWLKNPAFAEMMNKLKKLNVSASTSNSSSRKTKRTPPKKPEQELIAISSSEDDNEEVMVVDSIVITSQKEPFGGGDNIEGRNGGNTDMEVDNGNDPSSSGSSVTIFNDPEVDQAGTQSGSSTSANARIPDNLRDPLNPVGLPAEPRPPALDPIVLEFYQGTRRLTRDTVAAANEMRAQGYTEGKVEIFRMWMQTIDEFVATCLEPGNNAYTRRGHAAGGNNN